MKKLSLFLIVLCTLVISGCNPRPTEFRTVEINEKYSETINADSLRLEIDLRARIGGLNGENLEAQKVIRDKIRAFCKTKNLIEPETRYFPGIRPDFSFVLPTIGSDNLKELSRDLESFLEALQKETPALLPSPPLAYLKPNFKEIPKETAISLRSKTIELAKREADIIVQSMGGKIGKVVSIREADVNFPSSNVIITLDSVVSGRYTEEQAKQVTLTSKMIVQFEIVD